MGNHHDFDKLAADENENWVYKGSVCLAQTSPDVCSVYHAAVRTHRFTVNSILRPRASWRVDLSYLRLNRVLTGLTRTLSVATDWGENALTTSGYPRITKLWKRGTPLKSAETLLEGKTEDMGVWPMNLHTRRQPRRRSQVYVVLYPRVLPA